MCLSNYFAIILECYWWKFLLPWSFPQYLHAASVERRERERFALIKQWRRKLNWIRYLNYLIILETFDFLYVEEEVREITFWQWESTCLKFCAMFVSKCFFSPILFFVFGLWSNISTIEVNNICVKFKYYLSKITSCIEECIFIYFSLKSYVKLSGCVWGRHKNDMISKHRNT